MEMRTPKLAAEVFGDRFAVATGFAEAVRDIETLLASERYAEAAEGLLEIAASFHYAGYPNLVMAATRVSPGHRRSPPAQTLARLGA